MTKFAARLKYGDLPAYRQYQAGVSRIGSELDQREARRVLLGIRRAWTQRLAAQMLARMLRPESSDSEALLWFWCNHFNVFWQKSLVGAALPDFVEAAIRPQVRGSFGALLIAVLTHPAMLVYLDNSRNVAGRINENLARELLELHTLGVDGAYTQADVQEVARLLTGFGLRPLRPVRWPPDLQGLVRERGDFLFDPRRHDFSDKRVLGQVLTGQGYAELEVLVERLSTHPATGRHIAAKLGFFLLGEQVPEAVLKQGARVFTRSGGQVSPLLRFLQAGALARGLPDKLSFKEPLRWVVSAVRLLAAGEPVQDARPLLRWLTLLGQPMFACRTPDGYSLRGSDWLSTGQLTLRFELALEMVDALPRLLGKAMDEQVVLEQVWDSPLLQARLATLGAGSRRALAQEARLETRFALLLSCPEFMYWSPGKGFV